MSTKDILSLVITMVALAVMATLFSCLFIHFHHKNEESIKKGESDIEIIDSEIQTRQDGKKKKKVGQIVGNILFVAFLFIVVPLFGYSLVSKIKGNAVMIADKTLLVVGSGSMSMKNEENDYLYDEEKKKEYNLTNQFNTYDVICIDKVASAEDIKLYDVVAYRNDKNIIIIHRIIGFTDEGKYITRGDSNNASDSYNSTFSDLVGRYDGFRIQKMGMVVAFLQSGAGIVTVVSLIYILFFIDWLVGKEDKLKEERKDKLVEIVYGKEGDMFLKEEITYQGYMYIFNEGKLIEKIEPKENDENEEKEIDTTLYRKLYDQDGSLLSEENFEMDLRDKEEETREEQSQEGSDTSKEDGGKDDAKEE